MTRAEAISVVAGALLMTLGLAFLDWRLGLAFAGLFLMLAAFDLRPRRRT